MIAGSKARFKGTGSLHVDDTYHFLLTASDGKSMDDSSGTFRITIRKELAGNEELTSDSKLGNDDDSFDEMEI